MTALSPCELTVVIASHNRRELLRRCLSALDRQTQDPDTFEVIVADDGSTDGTAEMVEGLRTQPQLRVLRLGRGGKSSALNAAVDASSGASCLFLDDDVIASPELVAEHIAAHKADRRLIGIGALMQEPPAARDWYAHAFARAWNEHYEELNSRPACWIDCYGGNLSAPRSTLIEVGRFATDLPSAEDIELGYRLCHAGCVPKYLPQAQAVHDDQKRSGRMIEDGRRLGACLPVFLDRHPAMGPKLIGWFREPTIRDVTLRRTLLALRTPPTALALIGRLIPGQDRRQVWFGFVSRYTIWFGARRSMSRDRWTKTIRGVPVLMYHAFTDTGERDRYILPKRSFARQMRLLAALRYRVISFEDLAQALRDSRPLPRRAVAITIDDGYRDAIEIAHPILRRHRFAATLFIVSKRLGGNKDDLAKGRPLLSLDQVQRLSADGVRIGAHTRTHCSLPDATDDTVAEEVEGSREDLESELGEDVAAFAYPYGRLDKRAVAAVGRARFLGACTTLPRLAHPGDDPLLIPRIEIRGSDTIKTFLRKLWFGGG